MADVTVLILHPPLRADPGPLEAALDAARRALAARHAAAFRAAGASWVAVVEEPDGGSFGARLRRLAGTVATGGLVVLGSGALALARAGDYRAFVEAAASEAPAALANNRFSSDAVAVSRSAIFLEVPDLPNDNALPRWLEEAAGWPVSDLRRRSHLGLDLDSPADVAIAGGALPAAAAGSPFTGRLDAVRSVLTDRRAELTVAGRTSAGTIAMLERRAACRVRALVEERGLRAASSLAQDPDRDGRMPRPPASILGLLLDRDGPARAGTHHGPAGRRRGRRFARPAGSPPGRRRGGVAGRGGALRVGSAPSRPRRRIPGCGR